MKWLSLINSQYQEHGIIVEKYDVVANGSQVSEQIRFGYRSNEVGFGWTNASFTALYDALPAEKRKQVLTVSSPQGAAIPQKTPSADGH